MTGRNEIKEKAPELTARDERDIKKDLDNIMDKIYRNYHTYYEELLSIDEEDEYEFIG